MKKERSVVNAQTGIQFQLSGVKLNEFAILKAEPEAGETYKYKTLYQFGHRINEFLIAAIFTYEFYGNGQIIFKLKVTCSFVLHPKDRIVVFKDDSVQIPKNLAAHIMAITVGSARGILFAKTEGTFWQTKPMKLINVQDAITEDIVLSKSDNP